MEGGNGGGRQGGGRNRRRGGRGGRGGGQQQQQQQQQRAAAAAAGDGGNWADTVEETAVAARAPPPAAPKSLAHLSTERFDALNISDETKRAIREVLKFECMTMVQAATLPLAMLGHDLLAKAKTGTGKTIGFMLPVVEHLAKRRGTPQSIRCLVVTPTRDLAIQVYDEGRALAKFHPHIKMVCVVGGINKNKDLTAFRGQVDVLVATPGRLVDHLTATPGFANRLQGMDHLVFDEADRLLDMGFRPAIEQILGFLPKERQTLLYSATYPAALGPIVKFALKADHKVVDTVGEESVQTNSQVSQETMVVPLNLHAHVLHLLLQDHIKERQGQGYKVMVFFQTARIVGMMAGIFNALGMPVLEMHSRKSQTYRGRLVQKFRTENNLIMFTSDVSARGLDFESVTYIVQMGLTEREQYIHRLGRTARAGQSGKGLLMLAPFEDKFLRELRGLPVTAVDPQPWISRTPSKPVTDALNFVEADADLKKSAVTAYVTFLGYYGGKTKAVGKSKDQIVDIANEYAATIGLRDVPAIEARTAKKMGLFGCSGLNIDANAGGGGGGRGGGGRGGGRGGRGGGGGGGRGGSGRGRGGGRGGRGGPRQGDGMRGPSRW